MAIGIFQFLLWGAGLLMVGAPQLETASRIPSPTGMTAAQALNLRGPVMAVSFETATYAEGKEGKRRPYGLVTLDAQGYLTSSELYSTMKLATAMKVTCINKYDGQGRLIVQECTVVTEQSRDAFRYALNYDAQGRLIALALKITPQKMENADAIEGAVTNIFDDEGRISKQLFEMPAQNKGPRLTLNYAYQPHGATVTYQDPGKDRPSRLFVHDQQGRLTEWKTFSPEGTLFSTLSYQYNAHGEVSRQMSTADLSKPTREPATDITAYTYTYDTQGNWTKCLAYTVTVKDGKEVLTPKEAVYRMLAYYAPPK